MRLLKEQAISIDVRVFGKMILGYPSYFYQAALSFKFCIHSKRLGSRSGDFASQG